MRLFCFRPFALFPPLPDDPTFDGHAIRSGLGRKRAVLRCFRSAVEGYPVQGRTPTAPMLQIGLATSHRNASTSHRNDARSHPSGYGLRAIRFDHARFICYARPSRVRDRTESRRSRCQRGRQRYLAAGRQPCGGRPSKTRFASMSGSPRPTPVDRRGPCAHRAAWSSTGPLRCPCR